MNKQEHTPGRWVAYKNKNSDRWSVDGGDLIAADCGKDENKYSEGNAHRIAAAVNACSGIPTEQLEAGIVGEMREVLFGLIEKYEEIVTDDEAGRGLTDIALVSAKAILTKMKGTGQ